MPPVRSSRVRHSRRVSAGFTLVELIVTMMIVSFAVLGITYALSFAFSHQSDGMWQARTVALAESYIEEITARRYDENTPLGGVPPCAPATLACSIPGPDGEPRAAFDDVDDYDGLDESPPRDADGGVRAGYEGYRVQVQVTYASVAQITALGLDDSTDAKLVTVTVTPPMASSMSFPVLRSNY